ncbi:hypothetical protein PSYMO_35567, partial [Pseudomonas amygdali pv. mori str. 301020]
WALGVRTGFSQFSAERQTDVDDHEFIQSVRMNGHDPYAYSKDVLNRPGFLGDPFV